MKSLTTVAVASVLLVAAPVAADPIRITGGSLVYLGSRQFSPLVLQGSMGFTFDGHPASGVFDPGDCSVPECLSGTPISLGARWSGMDLGGTATLNGVTYRRVGSLSADTSLSVEFFGTLLGPDAGDAVIRSSPFSFTGRFFVESFPESNVYDLVGEGMATAFMLRHPDTNAWSFDRLEYRFSDPVDRDPAATPEPSTLALIGLGGMLGVWLFLFRSFSKLQRFCQVVRRDHI
jgi:PEP-CTERM motif-containing protein